jgi:hypothetical protein
MATKPEVLELYHANADMTAAEMAERLKCDTGYVRATLQRAGLASRPGQAGRPPISAEERAEREMDQRDLDILHDRREGHTQSDCAEHWGVSKDHVRRLDQARREAQ